MKNTTKFKTQKVLYIAQKILYFFMKKGSTV